MGIVRPLIRPNMGSDLAVFERLLAAVKRKVSCTQTATIERLRRDLDVPPPDVQEKVIKMLDLVSRDRVAKVEAYLRELQTAETCQHKPPHPKGCLALYRDGTIFEYKNGEVRSIWWDDGSMTFCVAYQEPGQNWKVTNQTGSYQRCLACEANK